MFRSATGIQALRDCRTCASKVARTGMTRQCDTAILNGRFVWHPRCLFSWFLRFSAFQEQGPGTPEMRIIKFILPTGFVHLARNFAVIAAMSGNKDYKSATSIYDFTATSIKGEEVPLSKYEGHVCLIVNVASKCGLTPTNYKELNELYDEYAESKGLRILAFPCNQFNGQEPGNAEEICSFADRQKVKFDLFEKIDVNGDKTHPLWAYLKKEQGGLLGAFIKWNFTKFIVNKEGKVVERHGPNVDPHKLKGSLEKYF